MFPHLLAQQDSLAGEASLFSMKGILRESLKLLAPRFSEADSFWQGRRRKRGVGEWIEEVAGGRRISDGEEVEGKAGKGGMEVEWGGG